MKKEATLDIYTAELCTLMELPYADLGIKAGFPSPAQDYLTESIDLNKELVKHEESTFYARVNGDSMREAGIFDGDLVVIDKSLEARDGDYIVAYVDGEFTLKTFRHDPSGQCAWLVPANPHFAPIRVSAENDFMVWGVVTSVIRKLQR